MSIAGQEVEYWDYRFVNRNDVLETDEVISDPEQVSAWINAMEAHNWPEDERRNGERTILVKRYAGTYDPFGNRLR